MRRQFILAVLVWFVGMAGYGASASAHDRGEYREYRQDWYRSYERHREARERYRADAESRAYERYIANREYRDYDGYCDHCRRYREGYYRDYGYRGRSYAFSTNPDFADSSDYSYHIREGNDRRWRPDDYPTGWGAWWLRMDREGRGGRN